MWVQVSGMIGANSKSSALFNKKCSFAEPSSLPVIRQATLLQGKQRLTGHLYLDVCKYTSTFAHSEDKSRDANQTCS